MKKFITFFLIIFISLFTLACSNLNNDEKSKIEILLPYSQRSVLKNQIMNFILTLTSSNLEKEIKESGISGENIVVELDAGFYSLNIKAYSLDDTNFSTLLYEGNEEKIQVIPSQTTTVSIKMKKCFEDVIEEPSVDPNETPETEKKDDENPSEKTDEENNTENTDNSEKSEEDTPENPEIKKISIIISNKDNPLVDDFDLIAVDWYVENEKVILIAPVGYEKYEWTFTGTTTTVWNEVFELDLHPYPDGIYVLVLEIPEESQITKTTTIYIELNRN